MSIANNPLETHHMVDNDRPLDQAFQKFISLFPYSRYQLFQDQLCYDIIHLALAESQQREAKLLISENKLPLQTELVKGSAYASLIIKQKA